MQGLHWEADRAKPDALLKAKGIHVQPINNVALKLVNQTKACVQTPPTGNLLVRRADHITN